MKRVIRLYVLFQFFFLMLVWVPVFYEFQRRIGFDDAQIFGIQTIYYLAFMFLEIPTGYFADRFGHHLCMKAGSVVLVGSNLLPIFFPSYPGLLAHFVSIALARSLISGAASAYLYDYLRSQGAEDRYKEVEGKARSYSLVGRVFAWAAVGPLMAWHLTLPYWVTAGSASLSVVAAWMLPRLGSPSADPRGGSPITPVIPPVGRIVAVLAKSPLIGLVMVQGIAIFVLSRLCQINLFQPILTSKSVPLAAHGLVMSAMTVFEAAGSSRPSFARKFLSDWNAISVATLVMAACLALIPGAGTLAALAWLMIFAWATGLTYPIQRHLLNDAITRAGESKFRATLLSLESLIDRGANAWAASLLGGFLSTGRMARFLHLSAAVSLGLILGISALAFFFRATERNPIQAERPS